MNISAISMLPPAGAPDPAALAADPAALARQFDAMLARLVLADLGKSMAGGDELVGELLTGELAATLDLGLGAALLRQAAPEAAR